MSTTPSFFTPPAFPVYKINFIDYGLACEHDMPCAVMADKHAVLDRNTGTFQPSWAAQEDGWRLIKLDSELKKWIFKQFFER